MNTCVLTVTIDAESQAFFDDLRLRYFPKERNLLKAHLTLFHKLPDSEEILGVLERIHQQSFVADIAGLKSIGNGLAYFFESEQLLVLHRGLQSLFRVHLTAQDKQKIRPHITIQNKVTPQEVKVALETLRNMFTPAQIKITGLDLWHYMGGPWKHYKHFTFPDIQLQ